MASRATGLAGWDDVARGHGNRDVNNGDGAGAHCTDSTTDVQTIPEVNKVHQRCIEYATVVYNTSQMYRMCQICIIYARDL